VHVVGSKVSGGVNRFQFSKSDQSKGQQLVQNVLNPIGATGGLGLFLNVPCWPVQGLVALFGRASSSPGNPKAPLINAHMTSAFSYAAAVMQSTENNRSNRGFGFTQRVGGSTAAG
jgi:hypothetical protein